MKKLMVNYGGVLIFYLIVVLGVMYLCSCNIWSRPEVLKFSTQTSEISVE